MAVPATEETRYARNGEVRIAFTDLGGAGGEPLLLIMGLAVSRFWWPPGLVDELVRRGFHVAAYDQRDAGQSTHFPDTGAASPIAAVLRRRSPAYTAEDMTDDAVAVLDALGWDSADLFGHSIGGQLAQRTALRYPGRVRSITSSASLPGDAGRLGAARYVRLGTVARLARMRFPEGHDGDIALAVAATRAIASSAYPGGVLGMLADVKDPVRLLRRIAITVVGTVILAVGLVLLVAPGPGLVVIALALAVFALEYQWARRNLAAVQERARSAALKAAASRVATASAVLFAVGAIGLGVVLIFTDLLPLSGVGTGVGAAVGGLTVLLTVVYGVREMRNAEKAGESEGAE